MSILDEVITVAEATKLKGVSATAVQYWIAKGWVAARQSGTIWLLVRKEVEAFVLPSANAKKKVTNKRQLTSWQALKSRSGM